MTLTPAERAWCDRVAIATGQSTVLVRDALEWIKSGEPRVGFNDALKQRLTEFCRTKPKPIMPGRNRHERRAAAAKARRTA